MQTVAILIGNSDDRLSQARWSEYIAKIELVVARLAEQTYFRGSSWPQSPKQNAAWVIGVRLLPTLRNELDVVRQEFDQDAIALVVGQTEFVSTEGYIP